MYVQNIKQYRNYDEFVSCLFVTPSSSEAFMSICSVSVSNSSVNFFFMNNPLKAPKKTSPTEVEITAETLCKSPTV